MLRRPVYRQRDLSGADAFTLIELLVAMTVLILLVVAVGQMVDGATRVATGNRQHLDDDGQARLVFDRMGLDFSRMLKRQDVDYIFAPQTGNDKFFFYSEAPAYFDDSLSSSSAQSPLSLIGYRLTGANPFQLTRLGKGLTWDETGGANPGAIVYLTPASTPSTSATPAPAAASTLAGHWPTTIGSAPDYNGTDTGGYHVIAEQVCRMEICFLLKPVPASGAAAAQPARYSVNPYWGTAGHMAINGLQDVRAVVVALAVLDNTSRQIAPDLSKMSTALRDVGASDLSASPPQLMAKIWQDEIDQNKLAADAAIPRAAALQVRIYQRHFYLDTN